MKIVLALCALFFAAQAHAASLSFSATAELQVVEFHLVTSEIFDLSDTDADVVTLIEKSTVYAHDSDAAYGLSHEFLGLFDLPTGQLTLDLDYDEERWISKVNFCSLGPQSCARRSLGGFENYGVHGNIKIDEPTLNVRWFSAFSDMFDLSFNYELGEGTLLLFRDDSTGRIIYENGVEHVTTGLGVSAKFLLSAPPVQIVPITSAPVPAGGILLLTGLAGLSLSRRLSSRRHPQ